MFFHIRVFLYSLIYWGVLEFVYFDSVSSTWDSVSTGGFWFFVFVFLAILTYFYQASLQIAKRSSMTFTPLLLVISTFGLLYFVQSPWEQHSLMIISAIAYYFIHIALYRLHVYEKDKTALGIVAAGSVAAIFLFYATAYGIYLNYAISLWILMFVLMLITTLISFQYLWLIKRDKEIVLNYSLVLGLIMAEIVWVLNFWPFGYLTTGVITLIFYYVFWDLVQRHFLNQLSKRRVIANIVFLGLLVTMVLSSTRWLPII